jgi:two-component system LytT family response regulator
MDWFKVQSQKEEQRIALSTVEETRFAKVSEIIRCESSNNYTTFF